MAAAKPKLVVLSEYFFRLETLESEVKTELVLSFVTVSFIKSVALVEVPMYSAKSRGEVLGDLLVFQLAEGMPFECLFCRSACVFGCSCCILCKNLCLSCQFLFF